MSRGDAMRAVIAAFIALFLALPAAAEDAAPTYGLSLFGDPLKYPTDFQHFDYVNPDAPKGGSARFGDNGSSDNLDPSSLTGASLVRYANWMMKWAARFYPPVPGSLDEPLAAYGL